MGTRLLCNLVRASNRVYVEPSAGNEAAVLSSQRIGPPAEFRCASIMRIGG